MIIDDCTMFLWWFCTSLAGGDEVDGLSPAASWDAKNDEILTIFKINLNLDNYINNYWFWMNHWRFVNNFLLPGRLSWRRAQKYRNMCSKEVRFNMFFCWEWNLEVFLRSRICNFYQISVLRMHKFQFTSLACTS